MTALKRDPHEQIWSYFHRNKLIQKYPLSTGYNHKVYERYDGLSTIHQMWKDGQKDVLRFYKSSSFDKDNEMVYISRAMGTPIESFYGAAYLLIERLGISATY